MMMEYLACIILLSFICGWVGFGFNRYLDPEMVFYNYGRFLKRIGHKSIFHAQIVKPLGLCLVCNTTWIGFMASALFFTQVFTMGIYILVFTIVVTGIMSAGISVIIVNHYHNLQNK